MKTFRIPCLECRVQVPLTIVLFLLDTFSRILHIHIFQLDFENKKEFEVQRSSLFDALPLSLLYVNYRIFSNLIRTSFCRLLKRKRKVSSRV